MIRIGDIDIPTDVWPLIGHGGELQTMEAGDSSTESEGEAGHCVIVNPVAAVPALTLANKTVVYRRRDARGKFLGNKSTQVPNREISSNSSQTHSLSISDGDSDKDMFETDSGNSSRKLMVKEMASSYRSECIELYREILGLQRQWRQEIQFSFPELLTLPSEALYVEVQPRVSYMRPMDPIVHEKKSEGKKNGIVKLPGNHSVDGISHTGTFDTYYDDNLDAIPKQIPLRRRVPWRGNERDALRRGLLSFGVGRSENIHNVMQSLLKQLRHGLGDITDCCWEFVRNCGLYSNEADQAYAESRYAQAKDAGIESGSGVSQRVGSFEKIEKNGSVWLRRIKLLEKLGDVVRLCGNKDTHEAAYRAIDSIKDASFPCEWWTHESDVALLAGIYKHGFGNYEDLRNDKQFADAFRHPVEGNVGSHGGSKVVDTELDEENFSKSDEECNEQAVVRSEPGDAYWPDSQILTRRLKRLVDHIYRESQVTGKPSKTRAAARIGDDHAWSKREKLELIKLLMKWGVPLAPGQGGKVRWQFFRDHTASAPLRRRMDQSLEAGYQGLVKEMKQLVEESDEMPDAGSVKKKKKNADVKDQDTDDGEIPKGIFVLTSKTAVRLKERLELMETLRLAVDSLEEDWEHLGITCNAGHDLPRWWIAGVHDKALTKGVIKHGIGNWDAIFSDSSVGFEKDRGGSRTRSSEGEASGKDDEGESTEDNNQKHGGITKKVSQLGVSSYDLPTATACLKRLKFVSNILKRHTRKFKPRSRNVPSDTKEVKGFKDSRRYKSSRPIEVLRDADGNPILPLALTERLTLSNLGKIEPDRPGFHTERHIFPIGFTTVRDHASMVNPTDRTTYTSTITDGGIAGPLFRVIPQDAPELSIEKDSPSGAWVVVCAAVNRVRDLGREKVTVSGTAMFGLSNPLVCQLIQELPDSDLCKNFRPELSYSRFNMQFTKPAGEEDVEALYEQENFDEDGFEDAKNQNKGKDKPAKVLKPRTIKRKREDMKLQLDINADPEETE